MAPGSTSNFTLSLPSKLAVLNTLAEFINVAFIDPQLPQETEDSVPTWFFEQCFQSQATYFDFVNSIRPQKRHSLGESRIWNSELEERLELGDYLPRFALWSGVGQPWSVGTDANVFTQDQSPAGDDPGLSTRDRAVVKIVASLQPVLTSIILDNAPVVFSPSMSSPPQIELELVIKSLRLAKRLYRRSLRIEGLHAPVQDLWAYLSHMVPYFPASYPTLLRRDGKIEGIYLEFNVLFTELAALASFASQDARSNTNQPAVGHQNLLLQRATGYVTQITLVGHSFE